MIKSIKEYNSKTDLTIHDRIELLGNYERSGDKFDLHKSVWEIYDLWKKICIDNEHKDESEDTQRECCILNLSMMKCLETIMENIVVNRDEKFKNEDDITFTEDLEKYSKEQIKFITRHMETEMIRRKVMDQSFMKGKEIKKIVRIN